MIFFPVPTRRELALGGLALVLVALATVAGLIKVFLFTASLFS